MKTIFLLLACLGMFTVQAQKRKPAASAQKGVTPPPAVMAGFRAMYPGHRHMKWEKRPEGYQAFLRLRDSMDRYLLFSDSGTLIMTRQQIPISELPPNALMYSNPKYPGKNIWKAFKMIPMKGPESYEAWIGPSTSFVFDTKGNFISEGEIVRRKR